ncbi:MAG: amidohydrolase family protein [Proteobacteria bacterium]|nr:amidohydrolase family protein [Pseudomonadota bacterium]
MTIDVHTHYMPETVVEMLRSRNKAPFVDKDSDGNDVFHMPVGHLALPSDYTDMDGRLAFMDEAGVDAQLLSYAGLFGADSLPVDEALPILQTFNDHAAGLMKAHPKRFGCVAGLPFADMDAAVEEYRRARNDLGLLGAVLPMNYFLDRKIAEEMRPIFEVAKEIGGYLFLHPGPRPDQRPDLADGAPPAYGDNLMYRNSLDVQSRVGHSMVTLLMTDFLGGYADVPIHVANLGGTLPGIIERFDNLSLTRAPDDPLPSTLLRNVHIDCSSLGRRSIEMAVHFFGAELIMFGTDCPIFSTERSLTAIATADISETEKQAIRHDNAARLLKGLWAL